jgi:hypothetical protein
MQPRSQNNIRLARRAGWSRFPEKLRMLRDVASNFDYRVVF